MLEIVVRHLTFSDQNWCLSEHVPFSLGIMSYHNVLTIGKNSSRQNTSDLTVFQGKKKLLMSEQASTSV